MRPPSSLIPSDALWAWQLQARCRDEDPEIFFPVDGERGIAGLRRQRMAKQICSGCDVKRECLQHSIRHGEQFGVWGGLSAHERSQLHG